MREKCTFIRMENWPIKECDLNSLQSCEIRCLRRCLDKRQDLPKELVLSAAKCDLIPFHKRKRRMKWLEHVLRIKPSDIPYAVLEFERGENRKREPGGKRK